MHDQRTCLACGQLFTPTHGLQNTCPPTDEQRGRAKGQPRSRCARLLARNRARGLPDDTPAAGPPCLPYDCAQCGKHCIPGVDVVPHASRFCGVPCKKEWHQIHVLKRDLKREQRQRERAQALSDEWIAKLLASPTRMQETRYKRALRADPCAYCGITPSGIDHIVPSSTTGTDDWTNWTGCCRVCNTFKSNLPLLLALPFVPVAADYHEQRRLLFAA